LVATERYTSPLAIIMNRYKVILILVIVLILYIAFSYFYRINKIENIVQNPIIDKTKTLIEIKNKTGFLIHKPDSKDVLEFKWSDFESINLVNNKTLTFKSGIHNNLEIQKDKTHDWFELILAVPNEIKINSDLIAKKDEIKNQLSSCQICGRISIYHDNCLNCGNLSFEKYLNEYGINRNQEDYILNNQEYWFRQENGEIDLNFDEPNIFLKDENWTLKIK